MFSSRLPASLAPNALALALARLRAAGVTILDLTESNPTRVGLRYPPDLLAELAAPSALVYEPQPFGLPVAQRAVAGEVARRGSSISAERIVLTASTSEAYSVLFKLLCDPGDVVLVPRPSYPLFEYLTRLDDVVAAPYSLEYHGRWTLDVDALAESMPPRARAVLVVNPNNPTGSFLGAGELAALAGLCRERSLALIGDEVFADYRLDLEAPRAPSVLDRAEALTFGLGGLSKSVGLPQLKVAWIAAGGPAPLVEPALARLELICDTYLSVATPVQQALPGLLARGDAVRAQIAGRIRANLEELRRQVAAAPSCGVLRAEGGWYAVVQVPHTRSEEALVLDLLEHDGVLVHPGYFFDFPREAFLVVSLLPEPIDFAEGVRRLLARVDANP